MEKPFIICSLIFFIVVSFLFSQPEIVWFNSLNNDGITDIKLANDKQEFYLMYGQSKPQLNNSFLQYIENSKVWIYSLDLDLNKTDSLYIQADDQYFYLPWAFYILPSETILVQGLAYDTTLNDLQIYLLWIDKDLNVVNDTILGSEEDLEFSGVGLINSQGNLVIQGTLNPSWLTENTMKESQNFFWEIDQSGTSINFSIDTLLHYGHIVSMGNSDKYHAISHNAIYQLNPDFSLDTCFSFNVENMEIWDNVIYSDNEYFILGNYFQGSNPINPLIPDFDLAVARVNEMAAVQSINILGTSDTNDRITEIDWFFNDTIFIGGTKNVAINSSFLNDTWLALFKTSLAGEVIHETYYGGLGQYTLSNIIATPDGGCIISFSWWDFYNYPGNLKQFDAGLIKVNANGQITGTNKPELPFEVTEILVYPNPGNDYLMINSAKENLTLKLFDLAGKEILNSEFDKNIRIETSNFIPQTYIYSISQNGVEIKSGKWIKN